MLFRKQDGITFSTKSLAKAATVKYEATFGFIVVEVKTIPPLSSSLFLLDGGNVMILCMIASLLHDAPRCFGQEARVVFNRNLLLLLLSSLLLLMLFMSLLIVAKPAEVDCNCRNCIITLFWINWDHNGLSIKFVIVLGLILVPSVLVSSVLVLMLFRSGADDGAWKAKRRLGSIVCFLYNLFDVRWLVGLVWLLLMIDDDWLYFDYTEWIPEVRQFDRAIWI